MSALSDRIATPEGKRRYVRRLFATIADRYDLITVVLSYGRDRRWKKRLIGLAAAAPACRALDLATGTGDIAFALASLGARTIGLDITTRMIEIAKEKVRACGHAEAAAMERGGEASASVRGGGGAPPQVSKSIACGHTPPLFLVGDMSALPFPATSFDLVTTGYGLRNVPDLTIAIDEVLRVLKPGGRVLSLDFNRPSNPFLRMMYLAYLTLIGSMLGSLLHRDPDTYRYIPASIRQYPGASRVARLMESRGFARVRHYPVFGGLMAIHDGIK